MRKLPEDTICQPEKCISLDNTVAQLSPRIDRSVRFVKPFYDPCRFDYCMLLLIFMPVNVCMRRGPICEWAVVHKHEHTEPHLPKQTRQCVYASFSKPMPSKVYRNARKVCTPRSKSLCRQPKVCIPRSLRRQTNKGKCVCFVLRTRAVERKCVYLGACADKQTRESVYGSF